MKTPLTVLQEVHIQRRFTHCDHGAVLCFVLAWKHILSAHSAFFPLFHWETGLR
jgi:hypothetical protein